MIVHGAVPPPWQVVDNFCHNFDLDQARCAPERRMFLNSAPNAFMFWKIKVIAFGKSLQRLALHYNNVRLFLFFIQYLIA